MVSQFIMNPHAVPSRMTIGQLLECLLGKTSVMQGHRQDATAFTGMNVEDIADMLENADFKDMVMKFYTME